MQKADRQPVDDNSPDRGEVDETVIRVEGEQFWQYAAVDPRSNRILHITLCSSRTVASTEMFLRELKQKHDVDEAFFLVDGAP